MVKDGFRFSHSFLYQNNSPLPDILRDYQVLTGKDKIVIMIPGLIIDR